MSDLITLEIDQRASVWAQAFDLWMETRRSENTRRTYRKAWSEFLSFTELHPWEVGKAHVIAWMDAMRKRPKKPLAEATIALRVAAVSSFYIFVSEDYTITTPAGKQIPLFPYNPAAGRTYRPRVMKYGKARFLSADEARALLGAIERRAEDQPDNPQPRRDYAMFLAYLATGRRNTEVRTLRWGDLKQQGDRVFYEWSGKGKEHQLYELPGTVYKAITAYLHMAERWPLGDEDYIFTALNRRAVRFPQVPVRYEPDLQPLSMHQVERLLRTYCRLAGINDTRVKVHSLRHTAAMLRREAGDDLITISEFLGHSSAAITQIYLHRVEGQRDESWGKVSELLGIRGY